VRERLKSVTDRLEQAKEIREGNCTRLGALLSESKHAENQEGKR
jgi:hypothetical protein